MLRNRRKQTFCRCSGGVVAKSCPTLAAPVDCSLPGASVHGILQASILEWVAMYNILIGCAFS